MLLFHHCGALTKNRGLSVMDSVRRWASALALKHATFLSHYCWSQSSTKRNQKLSLNSVRAQGTWKLLSGNAQCVVRIRPVMCNSSLENSFPLKLSWVLLLHISMLHHTEYIKFDVIFFLPFSLGTCKYPLVAKSERNKFSSMYLQMWEAFQVVFAILFLAMTSIFIILHGISWFKELSLPAVFVKRFLVWYLESQILHLNVVFSQI